MDGNHFMKKEKKSHLDTNKYESAIKPLKWYSISFIVNSVEGESSGTEEVAST